MHILKETTYLGKPLKVEYGKLARLATHSILLTYGDTTILAAVVVKPSKSNPGFLPLMVNYNERLYASGLIKTQRWSKREGRPSDEAVTKARLVDHCVRPLFPTDFRDEVSLDLTILSYDKECNEEIALLLASSICLYTSSLPFETPYISTLVSMKDGILELNGSYDSVHNSDMHYFVSYTKDKEGQIVAVEGEGKETPDEVLFNAFKEGYEQSKDLFPFIEEVKESINIERKSYKSFAPQGEVKENLDSLIGNSVKDLYSEAKDKLTFIKDKDFVLNNLKDKLDETYAKDSEEAGFLSEYFSYLEKKEIRRKAIDEGTRIDGRPFDKVRDISCEIDILPKVHGSALFNRGLTQVLEVITLDSYSNDLMHEDLNGNYKTNFFHHYIAPGFSTGDMKRPGTSRREIGHGMLAQKAIKHVLPSLDVFPYSIRAASEVLAQNGSSSMGSTCAASLGLMAAGVPITKHVGSVSMGLIIDGDKYIILTDVQGAEDFGGFMDFKMPGTKDGVNAIQMDIKCNGIPLSIMEKVIEKSKIARMHILDIMYATISEPAKTVNAHAPIVKSIKFHKDDIGSLIGPGGSNIKKIQQTSNCVLEIVDDAEKVKAEVLIKAKNIADYNNAYAMVAGIVEKPEIGDKLIGKIERIESFGLILDFGNDQSGMVHISEVSNEFVKDLNSMFTVGQTVEVTFREVDKRGKNVYTMK